MSPTSTSTLPQSAHTAAQNALQAALNDPPTKMDNKSENAEDEAQEIEVPDESSGITMPLIEPMRTVFDDQTTYNVKVCACIRLIHCV